jgi:hypothetical protein
MIDSVNTISASSTIAGINAKGNQVKSIAQIPANPIEQFSDIVTISPAASDLLNVLQKQNNEDYAQQLANTANLAAMGTVATQNQVQANDQPSVSPIEQFLDTATISTAANDMANDLQRQNDNDYAQQLADSANLAAAEMVATQNREIISAVYNMASSNSFRPRIISRKDLKI